MNDNTQVKPFKLEWTADNIDIVHAIQKVVCYCYSVYEEAMRFYKEQIKDEQVLASYAREGLDIAVGSLKKLQHIRDYKIRYGEGVVSSEESLLQTCIVDVRVHPGMGSSYKLQLDFFKDERTGVSIFNNELNEWEPTDVTVVEFEQESVIVSPQ